MNLCNSPGMPPWKQARPNSLIQFCAELLAKNVDGDQRAALLEVPEGPAVAGIQSLHMCRDAVDRTGGIGADQSAISAHSGGISAIRAHQDDAGFQESAFHQRAERNARF